MKTGLVLEGGGFRGIYTAGVLDVFMEEGLSFQGLIGVSAGAIHGCSFLSGQKGRSIRYYKKYSKDPRFMSFRSLLKTGDIVGADFCYRELPEELDVYDYESFNKNTTPFYVTCSNLQTGKAEYKLVTDMQKQIDILRASASLPFVSRIVEIEGEKYLDGGCTDSIPLEAFRKMGYQRNVVVLTREESYRKKKSSAFMAKLKYRKYPAFVKALQTRSENYNKTVEYIEKMRKEGNTFVIRPEKDLEIGRLENDPAKIQKVYDCGRVDALKAIPKLKIWLENNEEDQ